MPGIARALALTSAIFLLAAWPALAQKSGGMLKFFHRDSPASGSIHEEATISAVAPFMGVFNNLVLFDQHVKQNSLQQPPWVNAFLSGDVTGEPPPHSG